MEGKIVKILAGLAIGWAVEIVATDVLEAFGVRKHTAKIIGGIIGGLA